MKNERLTPLVFVCHSQTLRDQAPKRTGTTARKPRPTRGTSPAIPTLGLLTGDETAANVSLNASVQRSPKTRRERSPGWRLGGRPERVTASSRRPAALPSPLRQITNCSDEGDGRPRRGETKVCHAGFEQASRLCCMSRVRWRDDVREFVYVCTSDRTSASLCRCDTPNAVVVVVLHVSCVWQFETKGDRCGQAMHQTHFRFNDIAATSHDT